MNQPSHADLNATLHELLIKLGAVAQKVEDNGTQAKEGFETVNARLAAIESRVLALDRLRDKVMGALAVAGLFIAVIWWMIQDRIEAVFGLSK